jgi:hypothetical protein
MSCDFYRSVQEEEARGFIHMNALMEMLQKGKAANGPLYQHKNT